jgi:hypothetical protein
MNTKAQIVVKPTQSGKTFTMLTKIVDLFKENEESETRRIQLIFVDNNLLLANQTANRVRDCEWFENDQNEYLMFSSNSRTSKAGDVNLQIQNPDRVREIHNIIMCANNYRFNDAKMIIKCNRDIEFDIWIDESDKTFSSSSHTKLMSEFCAMNNVKTITLLTATPSTNLKQFKEGIPIYAMENTIIQDVYSGWKDATICHHDIDLCDSVSYARSVLDRFPECFKGDVRCFIPADFYVETHEAMTHMLIERGFTVLIINGTTCDLVFKLGRQIVRRHVLEYLQGFNLHKYANGLDDIPASEWIGDIYVDFVSGPFAITGNMCINRGTTLSSSKMLVNRAIMPPKQPKSKTEKEVSMTRMYQLAGRVCGNTMEFETWQPPLIFCTTVFDSCIKVMENRAKRLAEVAFETGQSTVTADDYETIESAPLTTAEKKQMIKDNDMELRGTVPEVLHVTEEEIKKLIHHNTSQRVSNLLGLISKYNPRLHNSINLTHECQSISHVGGSNYGKLSDSEFIDKTMDSDGWKKHIESPINKNKNNIKWKAAIPKNKDNDDLWVAYIDSIYNRIIISVWNGDSIFQLP